VTEKDHESYIDHGDHVSVPPMVAEESNECQNCDPTQIVSGTMLPASGPMWEHSNSLFFELGVFVQAASNVNPQVR